MTRSLRSLLITLLLPITLHARLKPGYDQGEALEMMRVCMGFVDTPREGMIV
jgi:hypothetical protein